MSEFEDLAAVEFQRDCAQYYMTRALFANFGAFVGYETLFGEGNKYWCLNRDYKLFKDHPRLLDAGRGIQLKFIHYGEATGNWYRLERDILTGFRVVQSSRDDLSKKRRGGGTQRSTRQRKDP